VVCGTHGARAQNSKRLSRIDFATQTLEDILRVQNALGDPWCMLPNGQRVILHKIIRADEVDNSPVHAPGLFLQQHVQYPALRAACGNVGYVVESTYAGLKARHGNDKLMRVLARLEHEDVASKEE
jgi:methionyl-tRNA formyltransferase